MKRYVVRLRAAAERDLEALDDRTARAGSERVARNSLARLRAHLAGLDIAPERGTPLRDGGVRSALERRATVLFRVRGDEVLILRALARGRRAPTE